MILAIYQTPRQRGLVALNSGEVLNGKQRGCQTDTGLVLSCGWSGVGFYTRFWHTSSVTELVKLW